MPRANPRRFDGRNTWKLTCDTYRHLSARRHNATVCHIAYAACTYTASISELEDVQNYSKDSPEYKATIVTMRQSNHTHSALDEGARVRISHNRHTKGGGETSDSDRVFAEHAYERFLKAQPDVASSEYDNLHRAFLEKTLECFLLDSAKAAAGATFARKTPDQPASDRPAPERRNPTPRLQPKPKLPPRDNADIKDSKPKNPDKNA
jgi:hypothetical protein